LPFSRDYVPGAIMEGTLEHVHHAKALSTYDFVDVVRSTDGCGWQVKSTKAMTPLTWKSAKIRDAQRLILASETSAAARQKLGNAIIAFCNAHARHSLELYGLDVIGFSRLIIFESWEALYYEKILCTREAPKLFEENDFKWDWSVQKHSVKKEQLSALHGTHIPSGRKWFAWHGRGENQL